jgi:hypothetical protein
VIPGFAASAINVVIGLWLIISPWALGYSQTTAMWNDVIVGIALIVLAGIRAAAPDRRAGLSWVNVVIGLWLFLAPFILQYSSWAVVGAEAAIWNDMVMGIAVIVLG